MPLRKVSPFSLAAFHEAFKVRSTPFRLSLLISSLNVSGFRLARWLGM